MYYDDFPPTGTKPRLHPQKLTCYSIIAYDIVH